MQMAFCLFKYFPYGGLQRDFLMFYREAIARGHQVRVYCISWQGETPSGLDLNIVPARGITNPARNQKYSEYVIKHLQENPVDLIAGFNKMPGLDVYYAADSCYEYKAREQRGWLYRQMPRYKRYSQAEAEIFSCGKQPHVLLISETEKEKFVRCYNTEAHRISMLPPGIAKKHRPPANAELIRQKFREEFNLADDQLLLLFVGSGFIVKGLDRAINAIAALPDAIQEKVNLFVVGQDRQRRYEKLARKLDVSARLRFMGGRDDVGRFFLGADCLIHPALSESAGIVLLEAVVSGLPVIVTDTCGYAHHIKNAGAGIVLQSPFDSRALIDAIICAANGEINQQWRKNALAYADCQDLYSMHARGVDIMEGIYAKRRTANALS